MCDKYDCSRLFKPYIRQWMNGAQNNDLVFGNDFWIAYAFGAIEKFQRTATKMLLECNASDIESYDALPAGFQGKCHRGISIMPCGMLTPRSGSSKHERGLSNL
jgi:hypothetical protein